MNVKSPAQRQEQIAEILKSMTKIRKNMNQDLLQNIQKILTDEDNVPDTQTTEIKVDRERNVKFVMEFLNSDAGASLKSKIFP